MSNDPQTTGSGAGGGTSGSAKSAAAESEPRYTPQELPEYLGVAPHIVDGALHGERNATFTVTQARKLVDRFLGHEDESEQAQPDKVEEE